MMVSRGPAASASPNLGLRRRARHVHAIRTRERQGQGSGKDGACTVTKARNELRDSGISGRNKLKHLGAEGGEPNENFVQCSGWGKPSVSKLLGAELPPLQSPKGRSRRPSSCSKGFLDFRRKQSGKRPARRGHV